jgi:hypothetical protein
MFLSKHYVCKKIRMSKAISLALICFLLFSMNGLAQHRPPDFNSYSDENTDEGSGFKLSHLFLGGSLNLGYDGDVFNIGVAPEVGYSLNRWFDVGVLINYNYTSQSADPTGFYNPDTRTRISTYGPGAFARFYPLPFLFLVAEPEYNWTTTSITPMPNGPTTTINQGASSLLLGIGYGRRFIGHSGFYISVMFDALSNPGSPYRTYYNEPIPVFKAGFDFYLHNKRA